MVIVIKEFLFRYVNRIGRDLESTAVKTDAWHHRSDALTSTAAFIGISVALIGGEGWQSADDWAALFACAVIGANGVRLALPAVYEIMDTAPLTKSSDRFALLPAQFLVLSRWKNVTPARWAWIITSIYMSVSTETFPCTKGTRSPTGEDGDPAKRLPHRRRAGAHRACGVKGPLLSSSSASSMKCPAIEEEDDGLKRSALLRPEHWLASFARARFFSRIESDLECVSVARGKIWRTW